MQLAASVTSGAILDWNAINWKRVYRIVKNLRQRIFRASRAGDLRKVRSLQRLMLRCWSNVLESVRRVTQVNQGKHTPGIDKILVKTPEARGGLCRKLSHLELHKVHPVRRVYIPKKKGTRPLGIPEGTSYGFRPGRGCHDAIEKIFRIARSNTTRPWVLDADIKGAFDHIEQAALLEVIGNFPARGLIKQWLKAGYVEHGSLHPTESGTPQGGVISPVLLNVALHGMEHALGIRYTARGQTPGPYALVRYADDLVVFCPTREKAEEAKERLADWLKKRGLQLSEDKTRLSHLTEGFNFLGFSIRHYATPNSSRSGYKLLIKPSQNAVNQLKRRLKGIWRQQVGTPTGRLIKALNPIVRGWSQYFRTGVAKEIFADLDDFMYQRAKRYVKRRHPTQSGRWRTAKYWGQAHEDRQNRWVFMDKETDSTLHKFAWTRIVRHRMVPQNYSPDDPSLKDYWQQRRMRDAPEKRQHRALFRQQHGLCPVCHQPLANGEELHVHHEIPKHGGGTDDLANLRLLHRYCQHQLHSLSRTSGSMSIA